MRPDFSSDTARPRRSDPEDDVVDVDGVEIPSLIDRLGCDTALARCRQAALEEVLAEIDAGILRDQIRGGLDVGRRQLVAVADQSRQLADDPLDALRAGRVSVGEDLVPLRADANIEQRLEVLQVLIIRPEHALDGVFGHTDALHAGPFAMRRCSSRSCLASTGEGAADIRSTAAAVLGNAITSRIEDSPARSATMRSRPSAMPP